MYILLLKKNKNFKSIFIVHVFVNFFRGLIQEYASKVWVTYFENERKCQSTYAERLPTQIQSASSQFTSLSAYVICLYDPYLNNRKAVLA